MVKPMLITAAAIVCMVAISECADAGTRYVREGEISAYAKHNISVYKTTVPNGPECVVFNKAGASISASCNWEAYNNPSKPNAQILYDRPTRPRVGM